MLSISILITKLNIHTLEIISIALASNREITMIHLNVVLKFEIFHHFSKD